MGSEGAGSWLDGYVREIRVSITSNASAFGYSVAITADFGVLDRIVGPPAVYEVFLFLTGAALAFAVLEYVASRGFHRRMREERPGVVVLGSAFSLLAVAAAVGTAALAGVIFRSGVAWPLGAFASTVVYTLMVALQMAIAARAEPPQQEQEDSGDE